MFFIYGLVSLGFALLFYFMAEEFDSVLCSFIQVLFIIAFVFLFLLGLIEASVTNEVKNQDIVKDLNTQIYYIQGYIERTKEEDKNNEYYETLVTEVNKYNKIYNTYKDNCESLNVPIKEGFEDFQTMVYNYTTNTITWTDGSLFIK